MRNIVVPALISVAIVVLAGAYIRANPAVLSATVNSAPKESTYDRILRTGTIRCGYSVWDPLFYIDPKTNEKMGIFHDEMEEAAKRLGVKVIWQEELGWGSVVEAVKSGRVDASCSGYWLNPGRIKNLLPSFPQVYSPLYVWMRQGDTRPIGKPEDLNSDQYIAGNIDGSVDHDIIVKNFPKAKIISLPELDSTPDLVENLVTKKVDFIVVDASTLAGYIANNPGKIKNIFPDKPMNVFPNVILLPPDDWRFKEVMDNILRHIEYDGTLDVILKKYHMEQSFLRNPPPVKFVP